MQQHMQEMCSCDTNLIGAIKWYCLRQYFGLVQSTSAVEGKVCAYATICKNVKYIFKCPRVKQVL